MPSVEIRELLLVVVAIFALIVILGMVLRIFLKLKSGPSTKKKETRVLEAVSSSPDSDNIFNAIISTKRIASNLKKRGIDTSSAAVLIKKAETDYDSGKEESARYNIDEAKKLLMASKEEWDKKTGFDVVASTSSEEAKTGYKPTVDLTEDADSVALKESKETDELSKADQKKPDNYLPSKFTISLAGTAIEKAENEGGDVSEAKRLLIEAKACFDREDYDGAFKLALSCKKNAETLVYDATTESKEDRNGISDLAIPAPEGEELRICSICGKSRTPYICIEVNGGEEATCKECYDRTMGKEIKSETKPEQITPPPPATFPPPPPAPLPPPAPETEEKREEIKEKEEEAHYCPNCGAKVKIEDVFCGKCGKPVKEDLKCVGCGTKVEPGDLFCRKCGARLVT